MRYYRAADVPSCFQDAFLLLLLSLRLKKKMENNKSVRKPNWSSAEVQLLLEELRSEGPVLFAANTPKNNNRTKQATWKKIAENISALGVAVRTVEEIKTKWKGLKKDVIEKDSDAKQTGGGTGKMGFIPFEESIRAVIGEGSSLYRGIEVSGCDSSIFNCDDETESTQHAGDTDIKLTGAVVYNAQLQPGPTPCIIDIPLQVNSISDAAPSTDLDESLAAAVESHDQSAAGTTNVAKGLKNRLLRKRRRLAAGMFSSRTDGQAGSEEDTTFQEYLKTEIQKNKTEIEKNNLQIQKLKKELEDREAKKQMEIAESAERLTLYKNLNRKVLKDLQKNENNAESENMSEFPFDGVVYV